MLCAAYERVFGQYCSTQAFSYFILFTKMPSKLKKVNHNIYYYGTLDTF